MSIKTRIPFQLSQTVNGLGLPAGGESVVLFNSVTAFGPKCMHLMDNIYWFKYSIAPNANATLNSVTAQYSNDGGTTWNEFYASATNEPVGDSTTFTDEIDISTYQDVRVKFNNSVLPQTVFTVNMILDAMERGPSE